MTKRPNLLTYTQHMGMINTKIAHIETEKSYTIFYIRTSMLKAPITTSIKIFKISSFYITVCVHSSRQ